MIAPELLALLRCPETQQPVSLASAEFLARLEAERAGKGLCDVGGRVVDMPIEAGLLRADGKMFFPIVDGLPSMLPAEAIPIPLFG